jgi:hypothetical protein
MTRVVRPLLSREPDAGTRARRGEAQEVVGDRLRNNELQSTDSKVVAGRHARTAVGVAASPTNASAESQATFEVSRE